jgi:hypothetical protein
MDKVNFSFKKNLMLNAGEEAERGNTLLNGLFNSSIVDTDADLKLYVCSTVELVD